MSSMPFPRIFAKPKEIKFYNASHYIIYTTREVIILWMSNYLRVIYSEPCSLQIFNI